MVGLGAEVVCLQEVTPATVGLWSERLREGSRPLGVLTAARSPVELVPVADVPWPERVLAGVIPGRAGLEVVNVHSPISPKPGLAKVRTHEAVFRHLANAAGHPRLVCGDLNTPRREHSDGTVWTFARTRHGKLRPERGDR